MIKILNDIMFISEYIYYLIRIIIVFAYNSKPIYESLLDLFI